MPKVSVIMSVHNGERYLREAVQSILDQTFTDFEFIIVDDGSTDQSWSILSSFADRRIKLLRNRRNIGLAKSLNKALSQARGEYVARMDADDVSLRQRLGIQVAFLDTHPHVGLLAGDLEIIDEQSRPTGHLNFHCHPDLAAWYLLFYNPVSGHGQTMFRTGLVREIGGYSESLTTAQDYGLWSRMALRSNIAILPRPLLRWRQHSGSVSSVRYQEQQRTAHQLACRNLQALMGPDWADQEACLEMIGFWTGRFAMCRKALRLWRNLAQVESAFVGRQGLTSSEGQFRAMLSRPKARRTLGLASHFRGRQRYGLALAAATLASVMSPAEGFGLLKRKLMRGNGEVG